MGAHWLSAEDAAFREEVRDFLAEMLPRGLSDKVKEGRRLTKADMEEWHAILAAQGWLANHWPKEWGGCEWTVTQKFVFEVETALAGAPRIVPFGLSMLGPVLIKYGNDAQKRHWLPRIVDGSDWWCQGFSEPGAGSDLASLTTRAERRGDRYVVNGQKTWTTLAQYADMIFCLVRTSSEGRKQEGISFLLIDMKSPGVEVRPIRLLDGDYEVNEVFFTEVEVPAENLVGEENLGWTYAKYLLTYERTNIAGIGASMAAFERLKLAANTAKRGGKPLAQDPAFARRLAEVEIDLENMKTTNLRALAKAGEGHAPGAESSMLKIRGTEIRQKITELMLRAAGPHARPWLPEWFEGEQNYHRPGPDFAPAVAASYFNNRKLSIFGGSNEVQRDIIAKSILGL
jgi:alkylation response protein AidB-like acyl-CoA dehydrogenase